MGTKPPQLPNTRVSLNEQAKRQQRAQTISLLDKDSQRLARKIVSREWHNALSPREKRRMFADRCNKWLYYGHRFDIVNNEADVSSRNVDDLTMAKALVIQAWNNPTSYRVRRKSQTLLESALQRTPDDRTVLTCLEPYCANCIYTHRRAYICARAISRRTTDWNTYFNAFVSVLRFSTFDDAQTMVARGAELETDPVTCRLTLRSCYVDEAPRLPAACARSERAA